MLRVHTHPLVVWFWFWSFFYQRKEVEVGSEGKGEDGDERRDGGLGNGKRGMGGWFLRGWRGGWKDD